MLDLSEESRPQNNDLPTYNVGDYHRLILPLIDGQLLQLLNMHSFLRTLVDFSLTHTLQMLALQKRELALADLGIKHISGLDVLTTKMFVPKAASRSMVAGCVRHKVVELCPHFVIATYLFARIHIPDTFSEMDLTAENLCDPQFLQYKLLNGGKKLRLLSYSQQYKALTKILKIFDEIKPIFLGRLLRAHKNADSALGAIREEDVSVLVLAVNLEELKVESLLTVAGFNNRSEYLLERAQREPPADILKQIFPFLDEPLQNPDHDTIYEVLRHLRRTLVQDMVEIKRRFPHNILCDHAIFQTDAFTKFSQASTVRSSISLYSLQILLLLRLSLVLLLSTTPHEPVALPELHGARTLKLPMPITDESANSKDLNLEDLDLGDPQLVCTIIAEQRQLLSDINTIFDLHTSNLSLHGQTVTDLLNSSHGLSVVAAIGTPNRVHYLHQVMERTNSTLEVLKLRIECDRLEMVHRCLLWRNKLHRIEGMIGKYLESGRRRRSGLSIHCGPLRAEINHP